MKRNLIIIGLILVLAGGLYYFSAPPKSAQAPADFSPAAKSLPPEIHNQDSGGAYATTTLAAPQTAASKTSSSPSVGSLQSTFTSGEGDIAAPDIQVWEVDYDGTGFSPAKLEVKVNDYVIFKNKSAVDFWPISNPHPGHTDYPAFDAKKAVLVGGKYQFQFAKVGSWGYHNELNLSQTGQIVVVQ